MLDLRHLVANVTQVELSLKKRGKTALVPIVHEIVTLDEQRRSHLQTVEALKFKRNQASQEIAKIKKAGGDDSSIKEEMKLVANQVKELDEGVSKVEEKLQNLMMELPNLLDASVPEGASAEQNVELRKWGAIPSFSFTPKPHDEIGEKLGILDFKKAGEVTGARFVFMKGLAARLERALIQFMIETHTESGYEEILPPFLVNRDALYGTGQLPKFEEDVFRVEKVGYYLIPTAEVPVTNYYRNEILDDKILTKKYVAYTPCFRSEAGSYGKDTKGMKRQHQFDKVELVKFARPEDSEKELEALRDDAEKILKLLEIPYRVVTLCGGDTGFSNAKTYDIEVWSPVTQSYMEISSCSSYTDFQARRASIRYRDAKGKVQFVHTLNGSGLAVGRTLIAIMENFQKEDGTFSIPKALAPYL